MELSPAKNNEESALKFDMKFIWSNRPYWNMIFQILNSASVGYGAMGLAEWAGIFFTWISPNIWSFHRVLIHDQMKIPWNPNIMGIRWGIRNISNVKNRENRPPGHQVTMVSEKFPMTHPQGILPMKHKFVHYQCGAWGEHFMQNHHPKTQHITNWWRYLLSHKIYAHRMVQKIPMFKWYTLSIRRIYTVLNPQIIMKKQKKNKPCRIALK